MSFIRKPTLELGVLRDLTAKYNWDVEINTTELLCWIGLKRYSITTTPIPGVFEIGDPNFLVATLFTATKHFPIFGIERSVLASTLPLEKKNISELYLNGYIDRQTVIDFMISEYECTPRMVEELFPNLDIQFFLDIINPPPPEPYMSMCGFTGGLEKLFRFVKTGDAEEKSIQKIFTSLEKIIKRFILLNLIFCIPYTFSEGQLRIIFSKQLWIETFLHVLMKERIEEKIPYYDFTTFITFIRRWSAESGDTIRNWKHRDFILLLKEEGRKHEVSSEIPASWWAFRGY